MNKSMYLTIFKLVLEKPKGVAVEIARADLKNLKSGLSKLKANYNKEAEDLAALIEEPADTIAKNFSYTVDEEAKASSPNKIVVEISLVDPPTFSFTLVEDS